MANKCPACKGDGDMNDLCIDHQIEYLDWEISSDMNQIEILKQKKKQIFRKDLQCHQ
jgi:hypothetical protein